MAETYAAPDPNRYNDIDRLNAESWYVQDTDRPFSVFMSVHGAGAPRELYNRFDDDPETVANGKERNKIGRFLLGGNMSTVADAAGLQYGPEHLTNEERIEDARQNMHRFLEQLGVDPSQVRLLNPQRDYSEPTQPLNVDAYTFSYDGVEPARMPDRSDFIYTYSPEAILGVRPADCPVIIFSADSPKGTVNGMIHVAWRGAAHDQIKDIDRCFEELGIDRDSARIYITPGGQAETYEQAGTDTPVDATYPVTEHLLHPVVPKDTEKGVRYGFRVDTPYHVYRGLRSIGFSETQIFADTSDTTHSASGYASHSRATRLGESNVRDLVIAAFDTERPAVASNPERPTPPEIAETITSVPVRYVDFDGGMHEGTIEVADALAQDVKDFFAFARKIEFPIAAVARSSDGPQPWDDDALMAANITSGFNYRTIAGTDTVSLHGLGRAFDVNPLQNPYIRVHEDGSESVSPAGALYLLGEPGVLDARHPLVIFMKSRGWEWGGDWTPESGRIDYQHFQKPL